MKRTVAWFAMVAFSLLALSAGRLLVAADAAPAAGDKKDAPGTPTELLASKGLTKNPTATYVLGAERDLADGLKQVAVARTKMGEESRGRSKVEKEVTRAKSVYAQLEFEKRQVMAKLETLKDPTQQNNAIAKINNLTSQMKEALEYRDKQEAELNKIGEDGRTKYINTIVDLAEAAEKAVKEYESLAADSDVKSALTDTKSKLGPTAEFNANLTQIKRLRGTVSSDVIDVKMEGEVPTVEVTLNKNFTRSMVFDSGASMIAIPADLAKSMELVAGKDDETIRFRMADGKVVEAKKTILKSVRVGTFTVENVEAALLPPELVAAEPLLGGSFLKHFTYKLDPRAGKLHLAQFGTEGTTGGTTPAKPGDKPADKKPAGK